MSKLLRFGDTPGLQCWSQVKMTTGETVWIGIAQSGILVKLSRFGIFGKKLFNEKDPVRAGEIARRLSQNINNEIIPDGMSNIVLISLTLNALECNSSDEFINRMRNAQDRAV